ncbi:MAG: DUF1963 domain-containing protein [Maledivibacter sp.]|jgi:hypothetical protein|nr:DUF1963 domain-containing protein [Maledivibacter sp.]
MNIWDELSSLGRIPSIAKIGGFRPTENMRSWFGGNFLTASGKDWPKDDDGYMLPIIQIYVPDVPNGANIFGETHLIQVFLNNSSLPTKFEAKNGEGWLIKEYNSISELKVTKAPDEANVYKTFPIAWIQKENPDFPCWEESWEYLDMTEINESDELTKRFFNDYGSSEKTKIGGYGAYIQSPPSNEYEYIFQISSEEKPKFMVADNGSFYILKSKKTKDWHLHWDCF